MAVPPPRRTPEAVAALRDGKSPLRVARALQPQKGAVVTETRLLTLEQDGHDRAARLRDLTSRIDGLGWLDGAVERAVIHIGRSGRSPLAVETAKAVAAALGDQAPALRIEVLDLAGQGNGRLGFPSMHLDRDDAVSVRGPRGVSLHVPRLWF